MDPVKAALVRGIANFVVKLPTREVADMDSIGKTEFPQQNVVLRWENKNEEVSDIRPDAAISTIVQSKYGRPLDFGEVKPDTLRLAILSKDTNDRYSQDVCFAFQVNGYRISFFMVYMQHQDLYIMVEVASFNFPSSLDDLDKLTTKKNLCTLARVSSSFWNNSINLLKSPISSSPRLPISTLYQLIEKSHKKSIRTTSCY
ncbi:hypothetical protein J3Q64DRAFT_1701966 [Phycomyces blakesleeanus]|uniref:Uncharacterized protein n=2 Tax=Phycomyces blakesleeanus TaxID=4837 RepID=A0A163D6E6_PHYB8|nr:hypothetical protein PHYBLDRAFT_172913 [Phycomyces blakesleeanus NRRL 1555(-)]OAD69080.1 hypothetical protein PHYBLDRAFT_172913 [Phycomyces blakesleeanus NRRL 1555(-)]|eukprot:XP_018287120.1 hypothetical protein PHYBLDRAFT_172913 [Phycomyces blakesleeanus NRRL 1555(-)]